MPWKGSTPPQIVRAEAINEVSIAQQKNHSTFVRGDAAVILEEMVPLDAPSAPGALRGILIRSPFAIGMVKVWPPWRVPPTDQALGHTLSTQISRHRVPNHFIIYLFDDTSIGQ